MLTNSKVSRRKALKIIGVALTLPILNACSTETDVVKADVYSTEFDKSVYRLESTVLHKADDNTYAVDKEYLHAPLDKFGFVLSVIERDNKFYLQMEQIKIVDKTKSKVIITGVDNNKKILLNPQTTLQHLNEKYHSILKSRMLRKN